MNGALIRFRVMAWVTGVLLAVMTVIGLPLKYIFNATDEGFAGTFYAVGWVGHGWLYILYLVTALDICFRMRYSVLRTLAVLLAGTLPFASFVAEHLVAKDVRARLVPML